MHAEKILHIFLVALCLTELFVNPRMAEENSPEESEDNSCEDSRTHESNCGFSSDALPLLVLSLVCERNQHIQCSRRTCNS